MTKEEIHNFALDHIKNRTQNFRFKFKHHNTPDLIYHGKIVEDSIYVTWDIVQETTYTIGDSLIGHLENRIWEFIEVFDVPHVHCEVIKAWADGAKIQVRKDASERWSDAPRPAWNLDHEYRVKPQMKTLYQVIVVHPDTGQVDSSFYYASSVEEFIEATSFDPEMVVGLNKQKFMEVEFNSSNCQYIQF